MSKIHWIIGSLVSGICFQASATETGYPTDSELLSLPPYCKVKLRSDPNSEEVKYWAGVIGPGFGDSHHLCQGLNLINRYYKAQSAYDRQYYLRASLPEFGYMISHSPQTSSLMPEVYMNRGIVLWKQGRSEAIQDFQKAIQLNPRLARSYTYLADFYAEKKLKDRALSTITEGLKHMPDSKMLQRRYLELGGKKPFPEPYQPTPIDEPEAVKDSDAPPPPHEPQSAVKAEELTSKPVPTKPDTGPGQGTPGPVIGVPTNPWCRFCPDPEPAKGQSGSSNQPGINQ